MTRTVTKVVITNLRQELIADWPASNEELLWGERQGDGHYCIDSIPFLAKGMSLGDIVQVQPGSKRRALVVCGIVKKAAHSTYRVKVNNDLDAERHDAIISFSKRFRR
jgi:hypothetical protein